MRRASTTAVLALLLVLGVLALSGCGTKTVTSTGANGQVTTQTVPNVHFAKTKFVLHLGLAFGAFHRYIYKPLRQGGFHRGASGRIASFAKAAAAALFVLHEVKLAREDALSDDHLRPLVNRIDALTAKIGGLGSALKSGTASAASLAGSAGAVNALGSASGALGSGIHDLATPSLGG